MSGAVGARASRHLALGIDDHHPDCVMIPALTEFGLNSCRGPS